MYSTVTLTAIRGLVGRMYPTMDATEQMLVRLFAGLRLLEWDGVSRDAREGDYVQAHANLLNDLERNWHNLDRDAWDVACEILNAYGIATA